MKNIFSNRIVSVFSSVVASTMVVALVGYAATTISTDISTGGTLTVTGTATAQGTVSLTGTSATTTVSGGFRADTADHTLVVDFSSSRVGVGTTSPSVLMSVHGSTILGSADASIVAFRAGDIQFTSAATTTFAMSKGLNFDSGGFVFENTADLFGISTSSPQAQLAVGGDSIFGAVDADFVSFRAGDIQLNSNATTTVTTKNLRGINVNAGDFVIDTQSDKVYVGTSTPIRGNLGLYSSATTTLTIATSAAGSAGGSCIELDTSDGKVVRMYATTSPRTACAVGTELCQNIVIEAGGCQ